MNDLNGIYYKEALSFFEEMCLDQTKISYLVVKEIINKIV